MAPSRSPGDAPPKTMRVVPQIAEIPADTWDALLGPDSSPFVEHAWLQALEESGCVGPVAGWIPHHLAIYEGDELVAAAPAYVKTNSEGEFVFDWSWAEVAERLGASYYPKLVVGVPFTPATGHRVLCHPRFDRAVALAIVATTLPALTRELGLSGAHVLFPTELEATAFASAGWSLRYGVQYHWQNRGYATFEDFLADLPQKKRTQIRRERKQPARDGVSIATLEPSELTVPVAHEMFALYLTTVDKYFYGRRYLTQRFFEFVAERFRSRLAWVVARRQGTIVAGAFNVKSADTLYGRYWGTTVDLPFLHFNLCYYHGIDEAIRAGLATFNPGAGGEHKKVRGFAPTLTYSVHHLEDPRLRRLVDPFLDRERRAIADYVAQGGHHD